MFKLTKYQYHIWLVMVNLMRARMKITLLRVSFFLHGVTFTYSHFACSTIPEGKWGTTCSLRGMGIQKNRGWEKYESEAGEERPRGWSSKRVRTGRNVRNHATVLNCWAVEKGLNEEAFHVLVTQSKQTLLKFGDYIIAWLFIVVSVTIFFLLNR